MVIVAALDLTPEAHDRLVRDVAAAVLRVLTAHTHDTRVAYSLPELARLTGLSVRHIRREVERGALPVVRPGSGSKQLVLAAHVELWLYGQNRASDMPQMGPDPARVERARRLRERRKRNGTGPACQP